MSHTRRTRANSAGHAGQSNTPSSSGSQASNVAPLAPAKASSNPTKFEIEIPPLDDSGGDCTHWCKTVPDPATDAQAHLEWSRRDQEAHLQLILALSRALRNCVLDATSAKEVWDTLKARYQGGGELHSTYLLERLFMTPFIDSEPMEPQIANVVSITCQLNNMGFPVSDQWLTAILKVKLPESWETLKTVLANAEEGKQTSKGVISQILAEEHRRIRAAGGDTTAYFTKSTAKGKKKSCVQDKGRATSEQPATWLAHRLGRVAHHVLPPELVTNRLAPNVVVYVLRLSCDTCHQHTPPWL